MARTQVVLGTQSRDISALIAQFKGEYPGAVARAMNRAGVSMRALMAQRISAELKMKSGAVKDAMPLSQATAKRLEVRLSASGRAIPLINFNARGPVPSRGRGNGVRTSLGPPAAGHYPKAFIATVGKGHRGVFVRVPGANKRGPKPNRSQLPIKQLYGPSIPRVFTNFSQEVLDRGEESLIKNLRSEIRYALDQTAAQ